MRSAPLVRDAIRSDRKKVVETLARAFFADPFLVHFYSDESIRRRRIHSFFDLIWRSNLGVGATELAGDGDAVALWRPPGLWRIPRRVMFAQLPRMALAYGPAAGRVLGSLRCMERHHPAAPHWYLMTVGTDPAAQRRGLGGALVRAGLARCDAAGLACYLESGSVTNIPFYQALGFHLLAEIKVPEGPSFFPMWRAASALRSAGEQSP